MVDKQPARGDGKGEIERKQNNERPDLDQNIISFFKIWEGKASTHALEVDTILENLTNSQF